MQAETTKSSNKAAKRRNRAKRRNKQRQQQRRKEAKTNQKKNCQQDVNVNFPQLHYQPELHLRSLRIWQRTYESAVKWHCEHQMNFWKQRAQQLEIENQFLRNETAKNQSKIYSEDLTDDDDDDDNYDYGMKEKMEFCNETSEYETSDEESPSNEVDEHKRITYEIDEGYLNFMEITHRHRAELQLARQSIENDANTLPID